MTIQGSQKDSQIRDLKARLERSQKNFHAALLFVVMLGCLSTGLVAVLAMQPRIAAGEGDGVHSLSSQVSPLTSSKR